MVRLGWNREMFLQKYMQDNVKEISFQEDLNILIFLTPADEIAVLLLLVLHSQYSCVFYETVSDSPHKMEKIRDLLYWKKWKGVMTVEVRQVNYPWVVRSHGTTGESCATIVVENEPPREISLS